MTAAVLADYQALEFNDGRWTRTYYKKGKGPAVIIIHEMPNLHPLVVRFANHVADAGMTVYLPNLFGEAGREPTPMYAMGQMLQGICIRREFTAWATDRSSPIVDWLRALARNAHQECGGKGVGAVGMCFTGNFALAMMTEPAVVAPVLSQPSLPMPMGPGKAKRSAAMGLSAVEISCAKQRFDKEGLSVIGLRFHGDPFVPPERFETFKRTFGDKFEAIELDAKDAAKAPVNMAAHSVLTLHLKDDDPTGPTKRAEQRVIEFFKQRTGA